MEALPAPQILLRQWLHDPQAITVAAFAISALFLEIAGWFIQRNLRHNKPGLRTPVALPFALIISGAGVFGADRLPAPFVLIVGASFYEPAGLRFYYADHRRFVRDSTGKVAADRWQIVPAFTGFRWTRGKANRHFFFSGDTGSDKTSGMNGLMAALISRNPTLSGVVMANKGDVDNPLNDTALAGRHRRIGREHELQNRAARGVHGAEHLRRGRATAARRVHRVATGA